ncbi:MAG: glycosyltransferase [Butyrivibrio sp.]|uniref:glycosyltransferase family 2 protein n=1 Tax=Butyrivibrio sp. TaxID=28121 RepID=UPI0025F946E6|nr:glycosyltransferase [Butyrivibrio sp.]MCR5769647.1 glycosyltransferase [Butyrivibrio sp.]
MGEPLITVIVPIYHVEKYLHRCIDSIIDQTYRNLEIILVDDGSDDGCPEICDEYAGKDNRIVVIHKENGGLSDARNKGIEIAKGEYLAFVDSDDYIHKDMYQIMMDSLFSSESDICMCSYKYVYDGKAKEKDNTYGSDYKTEIIDGKSAQNNYYMGDKKLELTVAWNKLYKRELFRELRYPKGKIFEDEYTTYKALYKSNKICIVDLPLYYYLQRNDSIIGEMNGQRDSKVVEAYLQRIDFYKSNKEESLWQKSVMHCLHMICYFKSMISNADSSCKVSTYSYRKDFLKEINSYTSAYKSFSIRAKIEIFIYKLSENIYYKIWKMLKKN